MSKFQIRKNDTVFILTGKDKGKSGRVLRVEPEKNRAFVENAGQIYEHVRPNPQKSIKGGIVQKEGPIHISNLKVMCPSCNKPARVGHNVLADGKKVRVCKKCQANIE
jgi:large subunit ribosomal protein L24